MKIMNGSRPFHEITEKARLVCAASYDYAKEARGIFQNDGLEVTAEMLDEWERVCDERMIVLQEAVDAMYQDISDRREKLIKEFQVAKAL